MFKICWVKQFSPIDFFLWNCYHQCNGKLAPFKLIKDAIQSVERYEILDEELLVSDASDHSAFIFPKGNTKLIEDFTFSPLEKIFSSHRELLGLLKTLETNPKFFLSLTNPTLYWQTV